MLNRVISWLKRKLWVYWMAYGPHRKRLIEDMSKPAIYNAEIMDRLLKEPFLQADYEQVKDDPMSLQMLKNLLVNQGYYARFKDNNIEVK